MTESTWTEARDAELVENFGRETLAQLEKRFGIARSAISRHAEVIGLGKTKVFYRENCWKPEEDARLIELLDTDKSMREIGWALGRTKNMVIGRVNRLGFNVRKERRRFRLPGESVPKTCQWPTGDGPYVFNCEEKPKHGSAYCEHHHRIAYRVEVKAANDAPEAGGERDYVPSADLRAGISL